MKKNKIFCLTILLSTLGISFLSNNAQIVKNAEASSYVVNKVPTTIDLNDASDSTIRSYYSSLNSLTEAERKGTNLLKNLKPILKNNQKYFSYGSSATTAVWQAYEILDRDWVKSPASSITGYNATTKIITNYVYGKSNSDVGSNPYIHALYVNRDVTNNTRAWGNHNQDQWGINQEHIWPKSCGFDNESKAVGARGDLMHLWAGNGRVNGASHSNNYYGFVDKTRSYDDAGNYASTLSNNLKGFSRTFPSSTYNVFEPQDSDKGDIARAIFYMAARYNYYSKSDSDGIDAGNPNLVIVNELNWNTGMSGYTSSTTEVGEMGIIQDLLEWNRIDPPDEFEIHRNNICYNSFTNNRNPFIDYPEWAEYIWGKCNDGVYDSTSTGYARPLSDSINTFSGDPVTKELSSISISNQIASLKVGSTFNFGGTVTAHYSDGSSADVTSSATFSGYNMSTIGVYTVSVKYKENGITKSTSYKLNVVSDDYDSVTWDLTIASYDSESTELVTWDSDFATVFSIRKDKTTTAANNYLGGKDSRTSTRFYKENTLEISPKLGYKIESIVINSNSDDYAAALRDSQWTNASVTKENLTITIIPNNKDATVSAVIGALSGNNSICVYYSIDFSIEATPNKDFVVGNLITKEDITVIDSSGNEITDFTFDDNNYQFTYEDAESGGEINVKSFFDSIHYNDLSCSLTVNVKRENYKIGGTFTDVLTADTIGNIGNKYVNWSNRCKAENSSGINSPAVYAGCSYGNNKYIQLKSNDSISGIITTASGGILQSISVTWDDETLANRTIEIYGKNTGYSMATDLYSSTEKGTLLGSIKYGTSTSLVIEGEYQYFGIKSSGGALYLDNISIVYSSADTAFNVSNYIMFEDNEGQCESKFVNAKQYFNNLSIQEKDIFMSSSDYVISTARERLLSWAKYHGEIITFVDETYVIKKTSTYFLNKDNNNMILISTFVLLLSGLSIGTFVYYKKRNN